MISTHLIYVSSHWFSVWPTCSHNYNFGKVWSWINTFTVTCILLVCFIHCLHSCSMFLGCKAAQVTNVEVWEGSNISWTPLTNDCVIITQYHIQFRAEDEEGGPSFITVPSSKMVFKVNATADLPLTIKPIYVVVSQISIQYSCSNCKFCMFFTCAGTCNFTSTCKSVDVGWNKQNLLSIVHVWAILYMHMYWFL